MVGDGGTPFFFAGPCVIESRDFALAVARTVKDVADRQGVRAVFKASFDKANRSSVASFRGPGLDEGLDILAEVKASTGLPVLTDVHDPDQAEEVAGSSMSSRFRHFSAARPICSIACGESGAVGQHQKGPVHGP